MKENDITLGSLFDGIGAIPYAASFFGIKPLWASEILPNAVSVTKRHFPDMEHLGDVTKLHGGKIPPVKILAFGSPCQSFSISGSRLAFNGKSVLFFEAIRIIREMREATNGKYPEIALFENVVGLFSVDSRRSYKTVLESFCEAEIPMPESGRWANAGMVRGNGVDLAWVVKDASKHFRVPQRRKRLFLIADFAGKRAGEILFISKSLSGYFAARESEREGTAARIESGAGIAGAVINNQDDGVVRSAFMAGQAKNARSIAYSETVSPTLKGSPSGLNQMPCICEPQHTEAMPVHQNREGVVSVSPTAYTLSAQSNASARNAPLVAHPAITGTANDADSYAAYCLQGNTIGRQDHNGACGSGINKEVCFTVTAADRHAVAAFDCRNLSESEISGTLQSKSGGGYSLNYQNPVRTGYIVRRLTPTEAERLMSLPDDWTKYGHDGKMMSDSARYSMCGNSIVVNVLAYIMQNIAEKLSQ